MGCCCENYVMVGCADFCSPIDIGFNALQNGEHFAEVYINNSTIKSISLGVLVVTDDLIIPASVLNEAKVNDLRVLQPDGIYYAFATDVDCARLTTQIHIT